MCKDFARIVVRPQHNMTQVDLAKKLSNLTNGKVKESTMRTKVSEIIKGKRSISAEFAILISTVLETSPRMWLNLQTNLDLWEARQKLSVAS